MIPTEKSPLIAVAISATLVLIAALALRDWGSGSLFHLQYGMGPASQSLLQGKGLLIPFGSIPNCPPFASYRMPLLPMVLSAGMLLFGEYGGWRVSVFKNLLAFLPIAYATCIVLRTAGKRSRHHFRWSALLLIVPFTLPSYLQVITTLQTEEGLVYALVSLPLGMLLFDLELTTARKTAFLGSVVLLYLAKSSTSLVVVVLIVAFLVRVPGWRRRLVIVLLVCSVPLSWAAIQKRASGRFSFGTSAEGVNFAKGNNKYFLAMYPPQQGNLDEIVPLLQGGRVFRTEWEMSDFFFATARGFMRSHPRETMSDAVAKCSVMLFTFRRGHEDASRIRMMGQIVSLALLRIFVLASLAIAIYAVATKRSVGRVNGVIYLLVVAAYCIPFVLGFGLLRHAFVLLYPAAILCAQATVQYEDPCFS